MKKLNALLFVCFAAVFASTARAQTSGVNNAELNGNYTFNFNGFSVGVVGIASGRSVVFDAVGRFTADGAGNLTNGELRVHAATFHRDLYYRRGQQGDDDCKYRGRRISACVRYEG